MKKRIALDMDEVIADFEPKFMDIFERELGYRPAKEEYYGKKLYQFEDAWKLRGYIHEKGFFADLPIMEDSQEIVKELSQYYDFFITTAAMEFKFSFEDKYDWLRKHFPFIHWKNIVFLGDKSIIRADYMIDDNAFNLETFTGEKLLYTAYHNVNETRFTRVNNWKEVRTFFKNELAKEGVYLDQ